jgi:hypothetical protein
LLSILAATNCLAGSGPALAGMVDVYTSESAFVSAIQAVYYLNDFILLPVGAIDSPQIFSGGTPPFSYSVSSAASLWGAPGSGTQPYGRAIEARGANAELIFTFTSGNVTAAGGYFYLTDSVDGLAAGRLIVDVYDGSVNTNYVIDSTSTTWPVGFLGFTSEIPISTLTLKTASGYFNTATGFYAAQTAASVPEPSSCVLCGLSFVGLGLFRRLRRKREASSERVSQPV